MQREATKKTSMKLLKANLPRTREKQEVQNKLDELKRELPKGMYERLELLQAEYFTDLFGLDDGEQAFV